MKKIFILCVSLITCLSLVGCDSKKNNDKKNELANDNIVEDIHISNKDKEVIIQGLNELTDGNAMVIDEIIYIHKIDTSKGFYLYDSSIEKQNSKYAYEAKLKITTNNENWYIYDYFYLDADNQVQYNRETLIKPEKYYFVDDNNDRLDYVDIDKKIIDDEIMVLY